MLDRVRVGSRRRGESRLTKQRPRPRSRAWSANTQKKQTRNSQKMQHIASGLWAMKTMKHGHLCSAVLPVMRPNSHEGMHEKVIPLRHYCGMLGSQAISDGARTLWPRPAVGCNRRMEPESVVEQPARHDSRSGWLVTVQGSWRRRASWPVRRILPPHGGGRAALAGPRSIRSLRLTRLNFRKCLLLHMVTSVNSSRSHP